MTIDQAKGAILMALEIIENHAGEHTPSVSEDSFNIYTRESEIVLSASIGQKQIYSASYTNDSEYEEIMFEESYFVKNKIDYSDIYNFCTEFCENWYELKRKYDPFDNDIN